MAKPARKNKFQPQGQRHPQQAPAPERRGGPSLPLVGGFLTALIVLGILGYALLRGNSVNATGQKGTVALADATKLHPASALLKVGSMAPNFHLVDPTTGNRYSPTTYMGSTIVLEFFATYCPVCHAEAPTMARITKNYQSKAVRVWSVLANPYGPSYEASSQLDLTPATKADLVWYAHTYNVRHPQLVDPDFAITNEYGAGAYPTIYVMDGEGTIRYASQGRVPYKALSMAIDKTLHTGM